MTLCFLKKKVPFFYRCTLFLAWTYFKIFFRLKVYRSKNQCDGGAIIASNHVSFFDPPLLAVSFPEEVHFLARGSLFKSLFGKVIASLNAHPIEGSVSNISVMKTICNLLKEKKKVILFPEGTRSFKDQIGSIKPGISLLVSRSNSAIIPAYIAGSFSAWGRNRKLPKLFGKIACIYGSPIYWSEFSQFDKKEAQILLAKRLEETISSLKKWYEDGAIGTPP